MTTREVSRLRVLCRRGHRWAFATGTLGSVVRGDSDGARASLAKMERAEVLLLAEYAEETRDLARAEMAAREEGDG